MSSKLKGLEKWREGLVRLAKKAFELEEPELVDGLNDVLRKVNQKIEGHRAQRRKKRGK